MATRRNRIHIDAGRAQLEAVALADAALGRRRFAKVFAFNVAPFWLQPEDAFGVVRKHLAKDGGFYLFWDARHFPAGRARELAEQLKDGDTLDEDNAAGIKQSSASDERGAEEGAVEKALRKDWCCVL